MHEIETKNVYRDFSWNKEMFNFVKYSPESKYYDDSNALVAGKMKDELSGDAIEEFFGLKAKI